MSFLEEFEQTLRDKCYQNELPFCSASCPFNLNVKELVTLAGKGRWNAAFRSFSNTVGFPALVAAACDAPCEKACLRCGKDASVQINRLEQTVMALARRKNPNEYNLPEKPERIAIVGGGISGLGCALFLTNKKYQVTVFEKADHLGGGLRETVDAAFFDEEIRTRFQFEHPDFRLNTEIADPVALKKEYDAVYVATGAGSDTGLKLSGTGAFASGADGVFIGGGMLGRTYMEALSDGLLASHAIERYLKTGLMNQPDERRDTRLKMDAADLEETVPVCPDEKGPFTAEEAAQEAARCVQCSCNACMRECDLMRLYNKTPRRLYEEVYITVRPGTLSRDGTWATRLLSTCSQCGLCREVCPQRIDIGAFMLQGHKAMHDKGAMPWAFHDYWLRDMDFSDTEAAVFVKGPACTGQPKLVLFPGCQMGASDPEYVKKSFAWLLSEEPEAALWLRCCGAPAEWAASDELHGPVINEIRAAWEEMGRPELVFGCPTCQKEFKTYLPEIPGRSLYTLMAEKGVLPVAKAGVPAAVFDPCGAREFPEIGESVRGMLTGETLVPLPREGAESLCCSYGGNTYSAAQAYTLELSKQRVGASEAPYITYCVNCRDVFAYRKKPVWHILDLMFGLHGPDRAAPSLTERWENRRRLAAELTGKEYQQPAMKLFMEESLRNKLSAELILESDMAAVIAACEKEGQKLLDTATGHFIGHKKLGHMTYWAEYAPEGDGYRLYKGYAHRMCLEAEDNG